MNILAMSGFVPEQICDLTRFTGYVGDRNISHYCTYASDYISQVLCDDSVDGAVFPRSCDSSRIIKNYLTKSGKFLYQITIPARQDKLAIDFFSQDIKNYKQAIETFYDIQLDDIFMRAELVNKRNENIHKIYEQLDKISYSVYLKSIHNMLANSLIEQKIQFSPKNKVVNEKRIYLVGSFLSNEKIVETIEKNGMKIVGDNLPESGRLAHTPAVDINHDIYREIAKSILGSRLSPSQSNFSEILHRDMEEIKKKDVRGVIFVTQKFCEPYDYLYSVYKNVLDDKGILSLKISLSDSKDSRKTQLAIEAFADMI